MSEKQTRNVRMHQANALILPIIEYLKDGELQAVILAGLCGIGAWVVISTILKVIFWMLWPLLLICGILSLMPSWRATIANDYVPAHIEALKVLGRRITGNISYIIDK
ncbi:uncharacterized protein LOC108742501 [Agrilus planipennis]|uniref:Uncharacterized protein LOC108742501 n=1 Tax=Agrilus planipennis TaxID=224129 RepID=A0A1W4XKD7_AGRPL|nr:uncharacterized protein LOC108742501 [Agrilus planipennis]